MENKNFSNADRRLAQTVQPCPTCHCDGTIEGHRGRELQQRITVLEKALKHALQTKHDIRTCACVECDAARAALAAAVEESK